MGLISRVSSRTYRGSAIILFRKIYETKKMSNEVMKYSETLEGHGGWVTQVATIPQYSEMLISASRDKTLIMWNLNKDDMSSYGSPMKRFQGHSHFVSDVVISSCGQFAVSSSWDKTLRLWDL